MGPCAGQALMPSTRSQATKWHRVPLLWFAAAILLATIGACILTIALAQRYPDDSVNGWPAVSAVLQSVPQPARSFLERPIADAGDRYRFEKAVSRARIHGDMRSH